MSRLKELGLVFENLDGVSGIKPEQIGGFYLGELKTFYNRGSRISIQKNSKASSLILQLRSDVNKLPLHMEGGTLAERIMEHQDLVYVEITDERGNKEEIYLPWGGHSDYTNAYQSVHVNPETNDLYIVIDPVKSVEDLFPDQMYDTDTNFWRSYKS
ncbi:hypothetical protein NSQ54_17090 [Alkalihalobacillus sp. FSL W8-0930]